MQLHGRTFSLTHLPTGFVMAGTRITPASVFAQPAHDASGTTPLRLGDMVTAQVAKPVSPSAAQAIGPTDPVPFITVSIRVAATRADAVALLRRIKASWPGKPVTLAGRPGYLVQLTERWRKVLLIANATVIEVAGEAVSDADLLAVAQGVRA